jgi:hypothetical protein
MEVERRAASIRALRTVSRVMLIVTFCFPVALRAIEIPFCSLRISAACRATVAGQTLAFLPGVGGSRMTSSICSTEDHEARFVDVELSRDVERC